VGVELEAVVEDLIGTRQYQVDRHFVLRLLLRQGPRPPPGISFALLRKDRFLHVWLVAPRPVVLTGGEEGVVMAMGARCQWA
jgi:hypothetical protein